jgi:hypothetical protein
MEVMHRAIVKSRSLKPLPGEITNQRINDATLPVKIEAARRAIAECTDLPELLRYKSQAEGLAAAVRTMKEVGPAMIRSANEMMADAWRKGGELLSQYSGNPIANRKSGEKGRPAGGSSASPRAIVVQTLGLSQNDSERMVRVAKAPKPLVYKAVQHSASLQRVSKACPPIGRNAPRKSASSDAYKNIMGGHIEGQAVKGLLDHCRGIRQLPLDQFQHLAPDERKIVKAKITEIVEILDEMDRLCR